MTHITFRAQPNYATNMTHITDQYDSYYFPRTA